ncbi:hypothetical protein EDB84DRAFT_336053 [Lactarius hengduanensis]|nr:hypothetical protein EDB84DRAFT_336053 [Lactarius hengduanensis]
MQPRMPSLTVFTPLVLLAASDLVVAQISAPNCTASSGWEWTSNDLHQSVCMVAAYMLATCSGGVFTLDTASSATAYYTGGNSVFGCGCNVIAYNLLSACDACQGAEAFTWSVYSTECTNTPTFLTFPNPVPSGTSVPQWALMDSILKNFWNSTEAYLIHQNGAAPDLEPGSSVSAPESDSGSVSLTSSASSSEASHISSTSPSGVSPTSSTSSSGGPSLPSSPGTGSNSAAIAGGVVGASGVVALAVIGTFLFYSLRKRQRSQAPSAAVDGGAPHMSQEHPPLSRDEMYVSMTPVPPMTFYDPNDPRTFPQYQSVPTSVQDVHAVSPNGNTLTKVQATFTPGYHGLPTV